MTLLASFSDVTKTYGSVTAVAGVGFDLHAGETLALVGHNGAGKTTLVKLILGLIAPTKGKVTVLGRDPTTVGAAELRRAFGFLPENVAFHGAMTGRELLAFYARLKCRERQNTEELLARVGLADAGDWRVSAYSKGMRQRLGLAQALVGAPDLLLLDEPTSGLDPASRAHFYETIDNLRRDGATILISTHSLAEIEGHADRIAVMHGGRLIALGPVETLRGVAGLPLRLRFTVVPCSIGQLLERFGKEVEVIERSDRTLEVGCRPEDKTALLRGLGELWELVEDVALETPGLPAIYSRLVEREEEQ
jgi:Cu-processing system ATP-binding protein